MSPPPLSIWAIWSENLNHLLPFYRDVLGLEVAVQTEGFVVLGELGGATLALGRTVTCAASAPIRPATWWGLATDDVDADCKRLKSAGVELVENPTDYGTVRLATLKDLEGNLIGAPAVPGGADER